MLIASFNKTDYVRIEGLTQWDRGRKLKICGLDIEQDLIEMHFAVDGGKDAIRGLGVVEDGEVIADIPDALLKIGRSIKAYAYISTRKQGKTIKTIEMVVEKRAKPHGYEDPEENELLGEVLEQLNRKGDRLQLEENRLQLFSEENLLSEVELPEGGGTAVEIESITGSEIDEIMKGEKNTCQKER